jgi:hypothetical protein
MGKFQNSLEMEGKSIIKHSIWSSYQLSAIRCFSICTFEPIRLQSAFRKNKDVKKRRDPGRISTSCGDIPNLNPGNFFGISRTDPELVWDIPTEILGISPAWFGIRSIHADHAPAEGIWQFACATTKFFPKQVHEVHLLFAFMSLGYELVVFTSSCKFIKFILVSTSYNSET